jgi:EAL domain-containing protein (putative c-di-GMP-specific phosphodiesterase class I)
LALANLKRLYDAGFDLAMDDFGTGYSSLAQLKSMPIHELKIDKSFLLKLDQDQDDQNIVRSTIEMAHHLGLSVIAEGVENEAALTLLQSMGCDAIQGYYLSKPMAVADMKHWLSAFNETTLESNYG